MSKGALDKALNHVKGQKLLAQGAEQETLFAEDGAPVPPSKRDGPGRPAGSRNKAKSKMRDYMAARGFVDPAQQLAMMAGLDQPGLHPFALAGELASRAGIDIIDALKIMRQSAADLLPYYHAKVTPEVHNTAHVQIGVVAQGSGDAPTVAAKVAFGDGYAPPPLPGEAQMKSEEIQQVRQIDAEIAEERSEQMGDDDE